MKYVLVLFIFTGVIFALSGFISAIYSGLHLTKLYIYLYRNKDEQFEYLTPSISSPLRWLEYIQSDADIEDEEILRNKRNTKKGFRYLFIFILATLCSFIIMMVLIFLGEKGVIQFNDVTFFKN